MASGNPQLPDLYCLYCDDPMLSGSDASHACMKHSRRGARNSAFSGTKRHSDAHNPRSRVEIVRRLPCATGLEFAECRFNLLINRPASKGADAGAWRSVKQPNGISPGNKTTRAISLRRARARRRHGRNRRIRSAWISDRRRRTLWCSVNMVQRQSARPRYRLPLACFALAPGSSRRLE